MHDITILLPMLTLMGWTLLVLLLIPFRRFRAGLARRVSDEDFRYGESRRVPGDVSLPNRNYMNLLEAPLIYYLVCLLYFLTDSRLPGFVVAAWGYVALRVIHSLIHVTYNKVMHRLVPFALSNAVLVYLWLRLTLHLTGI